MIPSVAERPGDDPIFSLNAEARRRAQAGEPILNATLGALMTDEGRLAVLPSVREAISHVPPDAAAGYAPISGPPAYLEAVVRDTFGETELAARSVAVATPGATGAILHAITSFLEPGQALLTTSFYWSPYQTIALHTRRAVEVFDTFGGDGRFDLRALERGLAAQLARQGRALVVLNFPCHNPTGYSLDAEEWKQVAEILGRQSARGVVTLLLDLAYARFGAPGSECWVDAVRALPDSVQLLVAWSASKAFLQYGARVGALVAVHPEAAERERLRNALGFACRGTWSNCNHLGMLAITELLTHEDLRSASEREREDLKRLLGERVEVFNREASRSGLRYPRYEGGFFVCVFTPDAQLTAARMRERGVFVVPLDGAVRVALCATAAADVPRLVEALAEGVRAAEGA